MERQASSDSMAASTSGSVTEQHWVRGTILGSGSYGQVNMALDSQSGSLFAVKSVPVSLASSQQRAILRALEVEIRVLAALDSPHIVRHLGDSWTSESRSDGSGTVTYRNLHLELAPGGSLAGLIRSNGSRGLSAGLLRRYTRDVVSALDYLHRRKMVHGDVKCLNVLIGESGAKLSDFGTARLAGGASAMPISRTVSSKTLRRLTLDIAGNSCSSGGGSASGSPSPSPSPSASACTSSSSGGGMAKPQSGLRGSPLWMSPETVKELSDQGTAVDIWSLGCTVLEMATGKAPWSEVDGGVHGVLYALGCTDSLPLVPEDLPEDVKDFILSCLHRNPVERPTAAELLAHPFLAGNSKASTAVAASLVGLTEGPREEGTPEEAPGSSGSMLLRKRGRNFRHPEPTLESFRYSESPEPVRESTPGCAPVSPPETPACTPQRDAPLKRLRRMSPVESSRESSCSALPSPRVENPRAPSFPLLNMASLLQRQWSFSEAGSWQNSPLLCSGKEWIVVRTP